MTPTSPDDHHHHTKKKRVGKACDLCRIKKTKCDGKKPCSKCIADNKLCAFTDKKKSKEKTHPTGYIELLETRLDLLTRLLDRIVQLAEPHLPFLQELMEKARAEHAQMLLPESEMSELRESNYVPINEVVSYLISDMGLLDKAPVEWERGAQIAATMTSSNIGQAAHDFASHKRDADLDSDRIDPSNTYASSLVKVESYEQPFFGEKDVSEYAEPSAPQSTFAESEFAVSGLPKDVADYKPFRPRLHSRTSSSVSIDSPNYDVDLQLQQPPRLYGSIADNFPKRANLLFLSTDVASSTLLVSSLTNRFENHDLEEGLRRRGLTKGPLSPSHQKLKHNGHVHKRGFQSHSHGSSVVSNNGNEFHFPKQFALSGSLPDVSSGLSKVLDVPSTVFDDDFLFDDLPSRFDDDVKTGLLGEEFLGLATRPGL